MKPIVSLIALFFTTFALSDEPLYERPDPKLSSVQLPANSTLRLRKKVDLRPGYYTLIRGFTDNDDYDGDLVRCRIALQDTTAEEGRLQANTLLYLTRAELQTNQFEEAADLQNTQGYFEVKTAGGTPLKMVCTAFRLRLDVELPSLETSLSAPSVFQLSVHFDIWSPKPKIIN